MSEPSRAIQDENGKTLAIVPRTARATLMPPKRVRVGAHDYELRQAKADQIPGGWFGLHCSAELLILLHKEQHPSQLTDTVLHEILHAVWSSVDLPDEIEEHAVSVLAPALLRLWQDNPKLIAWIDAQVKAKPRSV